MFAVFQTQQEIFLPVHNHIENATYTENVCCLEMQRAIFFPMHNHKENATDKLKLSAVFLTAARHLSSCAQLYRKRHRHTENVCISF